MSRPAMSRQDAMRNTRGGETRFASGSASELTPSTRALTPREGRCFLAGGRPAEALRPRPPVLEVILNVCPVPPSRANGRRGTEDEEGAHPRTEGARSRSDRTRDQRRINAVRPDRGARHPDTPEGKAAQGRRQRRKGHLGPTRGARTGCRENTEERHGLSDGRLLHEGWDD